MKLWYRFWYRFWRAVGSVAYGLFHTSQAFAHTAYLRGGKSGRRAKRPLTAIYNWAKRFKRA